VSIVLTNRYDEVDVADTHWASSVERMGISNVDTNERKGIRVIMIPFIISIGVIGPATVWEAASI
jgi:hypothetical protein